MNVANAIDGIQTSAAAISETIPGGTRRLMRMKERAWDKSRELAKGMDHCVHEYTWMALGVTAAVGIILGLAFSRR